MENNLLMCFDPDFVSQVTHAQTHSVVPWRGLRGLNAAPTQDCSKKLMT